MHLVDFARRRSGLGCLDLSYSEIDDHAFSELMKVLRDDSILHRFVYRGCSDKHRTEIRKMLEWNYRLEDVFTV